MSLSVIRRCLLRGQKSPVSTFLFSSLSSKSCLFKPGYNAASRPCSPLRCSSCHRTRIPSVKIYSSAYFTKSCQNNDRKPGQMNLQSRSLSSSILVDKAPQGIQPYLRLMRLDRPIGMQILTPMLDILIIKTMFRFLASLLALRLGHC
jgi:hypothetical protein